MNLRPRGRHKGRAAPVPPPFDNTAPSFLALSSDSIRTSLNILRDSADVFPPLKSAVVGVLAVWDLADRVSTSDENARALAWRAVGILDAIYNAVGGANSVSISPGMLQEILKFKQLLGEISAAMEGQLKAARSFRRVLHLRRHESQLAKFTSRLDAASEAFKIGSSTRVELVVNRGELAVNRVERVVNRGELVVNRVGLAVNRVELAVDKIQADASSTAALAILLEENNIRLHGEVQRLRTVVLFGLSPVFHGFGRVEVRAKLPMGDWLWLAIWMLPQCSSARSTSWRRAGMPSYPKRGINCVRSSLNWGPATFLNAIAKTYSWKTQRRRRYDEEFHTYALEWSEDLMRMYVDSWLTHMLELKLNEPFWERGDSPPSPPSRRMGTDSVPSTYRIMNVAVGGTNGWFPDGTEKPWLDGSATAPLDFLRAQDKWYKTWPQDPAERAMHVCLLPFSSSPCKADEGYSDAVKMWEKC
ncbi:concanavalin A-like lectin/glucanase domain-containing protein [Mycena vulgaris]|nr:concanavalin A-like lectin/glucanase domain-containing protein [Mycena vulgaris]